MNFLITGSNGQLGKEFQQFFINNKINYIATTKDNFDITNKDQMIKFLKSNNDLTHIINCAAYTDVDKAEKEWQKAYNINSFGVKNIVEISNEVNLDLIHFSTDYVFSGKKGNYTTNDKPKPINNYGKSKVFGEQELKKLEKHFLVRTSWLFGKDGDNFVKKIIKWSKERDSLKITTDEISSPTYTVDLVKSVLELIKSNKHGTYHITNTPCSRYEWAEFILDKLKWKGKLIKAKQKDFDLPAKRPENSVLDNSKFEKVIGVKMPNWQNATNRFLKQMNYI